jgi:hypothetical protein
LRMRSIPPDGPLQPLPALESGPMVGEEV